MSAEKRKGTAWETQVARYLADHGFPHAERRTLQGTHDRGDIAGVPGVVLEAKNHKAMDLAGWVAEAEREAANDGAEIFAVVAKRRGKADAGDAYAVMPFRVLVDLLRRAGL